MSIENSELDTDLGHIVFYIKNPANQMIPGVINIEYKYVDENNVYAADPHVILYDIDHTINGNAETIHITNTNIQIMMIKDSLSLFISFNGFDLRLTIESEEIYDKIIGNFNEAIREIEHAHLNAVNRPNLNVNNGTRALIGSYLTGQNGSIAQ